MPKRRTNQVGVLTTWLFAAATFVLVLGLVLGRYGARVRHAALVLFTLALLPSVVIGALRAVGGDPGVHPVAVLGLGALLSVGAYAVIQVRKGTSDKPKRVHMKRPFTHRADNDFIEFLRREIDRDA
jgi:hypothetical protein